MFITYKREDYEEYIDDVSRFWSELLELSDEERKTLVQDLAEEFEMEESAVEDVLYIYTELCDKESVVRRRLLSLIVFLDNLNSKKADEDGNVSVLC